VAVSGCGLLVYQAIDQYCQFDVITMTKIHRQKEMTLPAVTICSQNENTYDMIIECREPSWTDCKMNNLTLYGRMYNENKYCVQLNSGINVTEKQSKEGYDYGYYLTLFQPKNTDLNLAITDNSARVVSEEVREYVYPGEETDVVLSKTVQTALSLPYSNCDESTNYRQVNCIGDCFDKAMAKLADGRFELYCLPYWSNYSVECQSAYNHSSEIESKCEQECPDECKQVSFQSKRVDIGLDIDNYTLNNYKSLITRKFNISEDRDEEIKKRITFLYIYFDKLETTEITQSPSISLTSLIANVGGLLGKTVHSVFIFMIHLIHPMNLSRIGLFLGFSLLSSIEAVDLLIRIGVILSRAASSRLRIRPS